MIKLYVTGAHSSVRELDRHTGSCSGESRGAVGSPAASRELCSAHVLSCQKLTVIVRVKPFVSK